MQLCQMIIKRRENNMAKNYDQSKKKKEEFLRTSTLAVYMMGEPDRIFTREELAHQFDTSDREIREKVAELANYVAVISLSKEKGYRVPSFDENTPIEKLVEMAEDIERQVHEFQARCDNLRARMKPLVALRKVIDAELLKRTTTGKEQKDGE